MVITKLCKKGKQGNDEQGIEDAACLGWSKPVDEEIRLKVHHYKTSSSCFV